MLPLDCKPSLQRAVRTVRFVRAGAYSVARQAHSRRSALGGLEFTTEYGAALLYHTLRAIGYDSLSPFKRILAVLAAAELLSSLG